MALKGMFKKPTPSAADLDDERPHEFGAARSEVVPIGEVAARQEATVVGEIVSLRVVPQPDGSPWLEATVTDGTGSLVAMWTGRKSIAGIRPGQRLVLTGRGTGAGRDSDRLVVLNPIYELL